MYLQGGALELSQTAYMKSLNVTMTLAVLAKRKMSQEENQKVRDDLLDALNNACRFEHVGDLLAEAGPED